MIKQFSHYKDTSIFYNHTLFDSPSDHNFELHTHDICELLFLKSGDVSGVIGGKTYKLQKNNLIIFRPQVTHRIHIDSQIPYERFNILFDEKIIANKAFEKIPKDLDIINYSTNNYIIDIFKKLDFYCHHFYGNDLKKLTTNLIEEIIFNLTLVTTNNLNLDLISINPLINQAVEYIDKNFTKQITIDDVSNELYISKSYLHQLFINNFEISPKKYINSKRLAKAQNMIRMGIKPYNAYLRCGFSDYATFYRNYKQHFGHTPSEELNTKLEREIKS